MNVTVSLFKWLQTFNLTTRPVTLEDLSDGVAMAQALAQIAPEHFDHHWLDKIKSYAGNNWRLRLSNLNKVKQKICDFYADVLQHSLSDKFIPDVNAIAKESSLDQLTRLLQLILGCAINCHKKNEFIVIILNLSQDIQRDLMSAIQELKVAEPSDAEERVNNHPDSDLSIKLEDVLRERDAIFQKCHELEARNKKLQEKISLMKEMEEKELTEQRISSVAFQEEETFQKLQHKIDALQNDLFKMEEAKEEYRIAAEKLETEINNLISCNEHLRQKTADYQLMKDEIESLRYLHEEFEKLKRINENQKKKIEEFQDNRRQLRLEEEKSASLMRRNRELEGEVKKISTLKSQIDNYKQQTSDLKMKLSAEKCKIENLNDQLNRLNEKYIIANQKSERLTHELDKLKEKQALGIFERTSIHEEEEQMLNELGQVRLSNEEDEIRLDIGEEIKGITLENEIFGTEVDDLENKDLKLVELELQNEKDSNLNLKNISYSLINLLDNLTKIVVNLNRICSKIGLSSPDDNDFDPTSLTTADFDSFDHLESRVVTQLQLLIERLRIVDFMINSAIEQQNLDTSLSLEEQRTLLVLCTPPKKRLLNCLSPTNNNYNNNNSNQPNLNNKYLLFEKIINSNLKFECQENENIPIDLKSENEFPSSLAVADHQALDDGDKFNKFSLAAIQPKCFGGSVKLATLPEEDEMDEHFDDSANQEMEKEQIEDHSSFSDNTKSCQNLNSDQDKSEVQESKTLVKSETDHQAKATKDMPVSKTNCLVDQFDESSAFPSLPDVVLRKLQLLGESCLNPETLTESEIESKFNTLSIGFKTDKFTLDQRLELQRYQRDLAEKDAKQEIDLLKDNVLLLNQLITGAEDDARCKHLRPKMNELLSKIENHIRVISQTHVKIASRSEMFGAVRQEERLSNAFDVILIHADNLKRSREKERQELEEAKKLTGVNGSFKKLADGESDSENDSHARRSVRSISTTTLPKLNLIRVRRASVASIVTVNELCRRTVSSPTNGIGSLGVGQKNLSLQSALNKKETRSRRRSMPASPANFRYKFASDNTQDQLSHLEVTTEERGGSESDCGSSCANQESDEETRDDAKSQANLVVEKPIESVDDVSKQNISSNFLEQLDDANLQMDKDFRSEEKFQPNEINTLNADTEEVEVKDKYQLSKRIITKTFNFFKIGLNHLPVDILNAIDYQQIRVFLAIALLIIAVFIVVVSLVTTNIPPYTSWDEIFYRIFLPYISKEKVSRTQ